MWIYSILYPTIALYAETIIDWHGFFGYVEYAPIIIFSLPLLFIFKKPLPLIPTMVRSFLVVITGCAIFEFCLYYNPVVPEADYTLESMSRRFMIIGGAYYILLMTCYGLMSMYRIWRSPSPMEKDKD